MDPDELLSMLTQTSAGRIRLPLRQRERYSPSYYWAGPVHLIMAPALLLVALLSGFWFFWLWGLVSLVISLLTIKTNRAAVRRQYSDATPHLWYWEYPV